MQIKRKKAFSLFETVMVVLVISLFYMFISINFSKLSKKGDEKTAVTIKNIKEYLGSIEYQDTISLKCIEEAKKCLVFSDGELLEDKTVDIFKSVPTVYNYNEQMDVIDFERIDMDGYRNFYVDFELTLDKELKHRDMIVEVEDRVYYFNPIFLKAKEFSYLNEAIEAMQSKIEDLKYAF